MAASWLQLTLLASLLLLVMVNGQIPTAGLVGYYPFDGNMNDLSGNGNTGSNFGATATTNRFGIANSALYFSGSTYVDIPNSALLNFGTQGSIAFWVTFDQLNRAHNGLFGREDFQWLAMEYNHNGNDFSLSYWADTGCATPWEVNALPGVNYGYAQGVWYFVALVKTTADIRLYINGVLNSTVSFTGSLCNPSTALHFGRSQLAARTHVGKLDDVRLYNVALSATNVMNLFQENTCNDTSTPPALTSDSQLISGSTLRLVFTSSAGYTSTTYEFVGSPQPACNSNTGSAFWSLSYANCFGNSTLSIPINYALTNCSFRIDESTPAATTFSATLMITTVERLSTLRGVTLNQTAQTGVQIVVSYSTILNATSGALSVFGSRITFATVLSQTFNPLTYAATLTLVTSVQFPYQLVLPGISTVNSGFATPTIVPTFPMTANTSASVCNGTTFVEGGSCTQYWTVTVQRSSSCNPAPSVLDANWTVTFTVMCHPTFGGSCATPAPNTDGTSFATASSNYCPQLVVSSQPAANASLIAYSDPAFTTQITNYVFGNRVYFQSLVTSVLIIEALRIERVTIVTGAPTANLVLYSNNFINASNFFGQNAAGAYSAQQGGFSGNYDASPSSMQIAETVNVAGNPFQKMVQFSWVWSAATSSANTDASVPTAVLVTMRIRYQNQTTVGFKDVLMTTTAAGAQSLWHKRKLAAAITLEGSSSSAATTVNVANVVVPSGNAGSGGATSSAAGISPTITVAAAVVGGVLAVVVVSVAVVVVRRMQSRRQHFVKGASSVEMSSTEMDE